MPYRCYDPLPLAVAVLDPDDGRIGYINAENAAVLGHDRPADLIGVSAYDIQPAHAEEWRARLTRARAGALRELVAFAGRWYDVHAWPGECRLVVAASRDVTDRAQLGASRLLGGSTPAVPHDAKVSPALVAMVADGFSIAGICAALEMKPDAVFGALARVAGVPLGRH